MKDNTMNLFHRLFAPTPEPPTAMLLPRYGRMYLIDLAGFDTYNGNYRLRTNWRDYVLWWWRMEDQAEVRRHRRHMWKVWSGRIIDG